MPTHQPQPRKVYTLLAEDTAANRIILVAEARCNQQPPARAGRAGAVGGFMRGDGQRGQAVQRRDGREAGRFCAAGRTGAAGRFPPGQPTKRRKKPTKRRKTNAQPPRPARRTAQTPTGTAHRLETLTGNPTARRPALPATMAVAATLFNTAPARLC